MRGGFCSYSHDQGLKIQKKTLLCKRLSEQGKCQFGWKCFYSHEPYLLENYQKAVAEKEQQQEAEKERQRQEQENEKKAIEIREATKAYKDGEYEIRAKYTRIYIGKEKCCGSKLKTTSPDVEDFTSVSPVPHFITNKQDLHTHREDLLLVFSLVDKRESYCCKSGYYYSNVRFRISKVEDEDSDSDCGSGYTV